ncbi:hypothetical protein L1987_62911 [Smallanthus sonchifolius]|uniref:Uncharacterized protein n=1 Tax=Smallanthus sonchifolius TaxID=185202 RepID=A0ACB9CBT2_9ASTR|nr:hypothetical protein L1987_62911 [Smallanthus sonchifolius]
MFQSPRMNAHNKGLKIKYVIQISMLLGLSKWLLYQIHHSDTKKSFVTIKISDELINDSSKDISKLGRNVLRPKVKETKEQHRANDEQSVENEGSEDVEDHKSEEHEKVGESINKEGILVKEYEVAYDPGRNQDLEGCKAKGEKLDFLNLTILCVCPGVIALRRCCVMCILPMV